MGKRDEVRKEDSSTLSQQWKHTKGFRFCTWKNVKVMVKLGKKKNNDFSNNIMPN